MTHYFYYVAAGAQCDESTEVYKVSLGNSLQGRRDRDFLVTYAKEHGHYFNMVTNESDCFISNLIDSLVEFDIKPEYITGHSLAIRFKRGIAKPLDSAQLASANYQLKMLNTSYRIISNLNRKAAISAKRSTKKT